MSPTTESFALYGKRPRSWTIFSYLQLWSLVFITGCGPSARISSPGPPLAIVGATNGTFQLTMQGHEPFFARGSFEMEKNSVCSSGSNRTCFVKSGDGQLVLHLNTNTLVTLSQAEFNGPTVSTRRDQRLLTFRVEKGEVRCEVNGFMLSTNFLSIFTPLQGVFIQTNGLFRIQSDGLVACRTGDVMNAYIDIFAGAIGRQRKVKAGSVWTTNLLAPTPLLTNKGFWSF